MQYQNIFIISALYLLHRLVDRGKPCEKAH